MNREEPPLKRRSMTIFTMLPDDLILNCLARVSRLYYKTLSLVSKRFRDLLASTELYQTRILLDHTESCLYVCLQLHTGSNQLHWFTLCRRPNTSKKMLVRISSPNFPSAPWSDVTVVGPNIYAIGGFTNNNVLSSVMVMDCRSHTWREAPNMRVARESQSICVLDGKIYVIGGCKNLDSTNLIEVFDTKTQTWEFLNIPSEEIIGNGFDYRSIGYEETVYVRSDEKNTTYKLNKGKWREADLAMNSGWGRSISHCVIENVFYRCSSRKIEWYDSKQRLWNTLKGLERLLSLYRTSDFKLMCYGEKMVVLWEEYVFDNNYKEKMIWCAEIAIEKRQNGEIWGMLEWFDVVYTFNEQYSLVHVLATTI